MQHFGTLKGLSQSCWKIPYCMGIWKKLTGTQLSRCRLSSGVSRPSPSSDVTSTAHATMIQSLASGVPYMRANPQQHSFLQILYFIILFHHQFFVLFCGITVPSTGTQLLTWMLRTKILYIYASKDRWGQQMAHGQVSNERDTAAKRPAGETRAPMALKNISC